MINAVSLDHIKLNLAKIQNDLELAQAKKTKLIAVSKTFPTEYIKFAYQLQQFDFGENRVKDLLTKAVELDRDEFKFIRWHFIGHLQSNKVKELLKVPRLKSIQSIDSLNLIHELIKHEKLVSNPIELFLQINTSKEEEKSGFEMENSREIDTAIELIQKGSSKFKLKGLMTIGKMRSDDFITDAKICFTKLIELKKTLDTKYGLALELSFGMSQDYHEAIKLGSNYIRIGQGIFGTR